MGLVGQRHAYKPRPSQTLCACMWAEHHAHRAYNSAAHLAHVRGQLCAHHPCSSLGVCTAPCAPSTHIMHVCGQSIVPTIHTALQLICIFAQHHVPHPRTPQALHACMWAEHHAHHKDIVAAHLGGGQHHAPPPAHHHRVIELCQLGRGFWGCEEGERRGVGQPSVVEERGEDRAAIECQAPASTAARDEERVLGSNKLWRGEMTRF
eukprot:1159002-Pelagomonas_calceolata.AAC.7